MYKRLSDYYDKIFPFEQSIADKLEWEFPNPGKGNLLEEEFLPGSSFLFLLSAKLPS